MAVFLIHKYLLFDIVFLIHKYLVWHCFSYPNIWINECARVQLTDIWSSTVTRHPKIEGCIHKYPIGVYISYWRIHAQTQTASLHLLTKSRVSVHVNEVSWRLINILLEFVFLIQEYRWWHPQNSISSPFCEL